MLPAASVREIDVSTLLLNDTSTAVGDAYTLVNGIHRVTAKIVGFAPGNDVGICMSPATLAAVTLITMLTLLIIAVSILGMLNTVARQIRERAHDIGIFKALGMTSGQTLTMVICSVSITGLVGCPGRRPDAPRRAPGYGPRGQLRACRPRCSPSTRRRNWRSATALRTE